MYETYMCIINVVERINDLSNDIIAIEESNRKIMQ